MWMIAIGVAQRSVRRNATRPQQAQNLCFCRVIAKRMLAPGLRQFTEIYQIVLGLG
jgi:hypothetical protein